MLIIDKNNKITMINGDTGILNLKVSNHILKDGDRVTLTVKATLDAKPLISKTIDTFNEDGTCSIVLDPMDTVSLKAGTYIYDIQLNLADGRVDTIIGPVAFTIIRGVTD